MDNRYIDTFGYNIKGVFLEFDSLPFVQDTGTGKGNVEFGRKCRYMDNSGETSLPDK